MSLEAAVVFLMFWAALITAVVSWLVWDYLRFKGTAVMQNLADKLQSDKFIVPNHGVFSVKRKRKPKVRDDAAALKAEQEESQS